MEDHVGRHAVRVRCFAPPAFECFEQFGVGAIEAGFHRAFGAARCAAVLFALPCRRRSFAHPNLTLLAEDRADSVVISDRERGPLIVAFAQHTFEQQMFNHVAPNRLGLIGADAEGRARGVAFVHAVAGAADEVCNDPATPDTLIHPHHCRDRL